MGKKKTKSDPAKVVEKSAPVSKAMVGDRKSAPRKRTIKKSQRPRMRKNNPRKIRA